MSDRVKIKSCHSSSRGTADTRLIRMRVVVEGKKTERGVSLINIRGAGQSLWFFARHLGRQSLANLLCYCVLGKRVSSVALMEVLGLFGLTILDVFQDSPRDANKILGSLCAKECAKSLDNEAKKAWMEMLLSLQSEKDATELCVVIQSNIDDLKSIPAKPTASTNKSGEEIAGAVLAEDDKDDDPQDPITALENMGELGSGGGTAK